MTEKHPEWTEFPHARLIDTTPITQVHVLSRVLERPSYEILAPLLLRQIDCDRSQPSGPTIALRLRKYTRCPRHAIDPRTAARRGGCDAEIRPRSDLVPRPAAALLRRIGPPGRRPGNRRRWAADPAARPCARATSKCADAIAEGAKGLASVRICSSAWDENGAKACSAALRSPRLKCRRAKTAFRYPGCA